MIVLFHFLLNIIGLVLLFIFIKGIVIQYKEKQNDKIKLRAIYKIIFAFGILLLIPIVFGNFLSFEPDLKSTKKKIRFHTIYRNYLELNKVYYDTLILDPLNTNLHFAYVSTLSDHIEKLNEHGSYDPKKLKDTFVSMQTENFYRNFINSEDSNKQDLGRIFLALHRINLEEYPKAIELIDSVRQDTSALFNFVYGTYLSQSRNVDNYQMADSLLGLSLTNKLTAKKAYDELASLYYYFGENNKLDSLVKNPLSTAYIADFLKACNIYARL